MSYKAIILHDAEQKSWLTEMARSELLQVVKLIKAGDIDVAARKYIEIGGNPAGITKTISSYLKKVPDEDPANFQKFRKRVFEIKTTKMPAGKRKYEKKVVSGTTKEGKKVEVITGRTQEQMKRQNLKRLRKEAGKIIKEKEILEKGSTEEKQKLAKDILADWNISKEPSKENEVAYVLWDFVGKKENEKQATTIMKKVIEQGAETTEKLAQASISKEPVLPFKTEKEEQEKKKVYKTIERKKAMKEDILYEQILRDVYNYQGIHFWENYILSNIVKTFPKYIAEYGEKNAVEMFVAVYGKQTKPLFEYMIDNEEMLVETALIAGEGLLFEEIGEKNVTRYITEADVGIGGALKSAGANFSGLLTKARENIGGRLAKSGTASSITGFLKGLWDKLKGIGKSAFPKIIDFLKSKFKWAKELVTQGVGWIASNPIARVAVPALLIGGGILGAVKLINKLRKKAGKKQMSQKEVEALKGMEQKNKATLDMYKKK